MRKKDAGAIHKTMVYMVILWVVVCFCVLFNLMKAGYASAYIEDCLMQANLAALLTDPYHYGSTGELVFEDIYKTRNDFEEILRECMKRENLPEGLGILEPLVIQDFRIYEVTEQGTAEFVFDSVGGVSSCKYEPGQALQAPDGTDITQSALYARITVPVRFMFGLEIEAEKEHCVDVKGR